MTCGIYAIVNLASGALYIGGSVNVRHRWSVHRHMLNRGAHHSPPLQRAWLKRGAESFEFALLEECQPEDLERREQLYIDALKPTYNLGTTARPGLGMKRSDETRRKIAAALKGNKNGAGTKPAETRAKIAASHLGKPKYFLRGRKRPPEVVARISAAQKGKPRPWQLGRRHSPETIQRMRLAALANREARSHAAQVRWSANQSR